MTPIEASAPGKLMLFGEHAVVYGYPSIVTAVDQRIYAKAESVAAKTFSVIAPEVEMPEYSKSVEDVGNGQIPRSVEFLERLYARFRAKYPQAQGISVTTRSEFSSKFGFGSSSAVTAAFAKALNELYSTNMTEQEMFDLCYKTVLDVQGVGSGFDLAAAIWGGTLYYVKPAKVVEQLRIDELPLVVGYTGIKADTASIVNRVKAEKEHGPVVDGIFDQVGALVEIAKTAILAADWRLVGELMTQNQALLEELRVSSPELDILIDAADAAGAYGAKLSGAGGGDCMIAVTDVHKKEDVERGIASAISIQGTMKAGQVIHVHTHAQGARIEG